MIGTKRDKEGRGNLYAAVILSALLAAMVLLLAGCRGAEKGGGYTQSIKITAESVNESGVLVMIEYYRDIELVTSMRLIDGDGDGIVDGKSGPSERDQWPKGWEWFDDLFEEVIVGSSTLAVEDEKIKVQNGAIHEFRTGEYQAETVE